MKFYAFDTETINRPGHGEACLLIKMTDEGVKFHEFPRSFDQICKFLVGGKWLCWNMDFDVRAIVHDNFIPYTVVENLGLFGRAQWSDYTFRYISGKSFKCWGPLGSFEIYDLQQFYGSSLKAASERYLPTDSQKLEIPNSWYSCMDNCLRDGRRQRILDYAAQDVIATQALADKLMAQIKRLGMEPRSLSSCAGLARLKYGKLLQTVVPPVYVNRIFQKTFFGGRIEVGTLGSIGPCSLYDIHSAYPSVIARLLDPRGTVLLSDEKTWKFQGASYGAYEIRAHVPTSWHWGPLAVRRGVKVIYPVGVFRTHCGVAAIETLRRRKVKFEVLRAYEIFQANKTPFLPGIVDLYLKRKDPDISLSVKTILNSIYGLTAESTNYNLEEEYLNARARVVGSRLVQSRSAFGKCTNFILAAHITETIRMKLWEVLHDAGEKAYFGATDGVLLSRAGNVVQNDALGGWGRKAEPDRASILGCGRYVLDSGDFQEIHMRGFPVGPRTLEKLRRTKRPYSMIPSLDTQSLRQWAGGFEGDLNVLKPVLRRFEIADDKRYWFGRFKRIKDAWALTIQSKPFIMGTVEELKAMEK